MYVYKDKNGLVTVRSMQKLYRPNETEDEVEDDFDTSSEASEAERVLSLANVSRPSNETAIYAVKYMEARQFLSDPETPIEYFVHLIDEANDESISPKDLALRIVSNYKLVAAKERERRSEKLSLNS